MSEWDRVIVYLQPGDVITSKKGFLHVVNSEQYQTKKIRHVGNGVVEALGEKPQYMPFRKREGRIRSSERQLVRREGEMSEKLVSGAEARSN